MKKLLLMLLGALFALPAFAADGDDFQFTYEGQTLTYTVISEADKTVRTKEGSYEDPGNSITGDLILPEKVQYNGSEYTLTEIGNWAFYQCDGLTSVVIPNSVTTIGEWAFAKCRSLTSLEIPNSVTTIGESAFSRCSGMTSVVIPNSVTSIGNDAFYGCSGLTTIEIPNSVTSIGHGAFADCTGLTSIEIPNSVTSLGSSAFSGCTGLTSVTIGNSVKTIGGFAFNSCSSLTSIEIPNSVTTIGEKAFTECTSLTDLQLPETVTNIGPYAFSYCQSLVTFHWPSEMTYIPEGTFAYCSSLEKVYFSDKVTSIGADAFYACSSLRSMMIPDGVKTIPTNMMANCVSVREILIPNSVTKIERYAFANCMALRNIDLGTKVYDIADHAFDGCENITEIHSMALYPPYAQQYTFPMDSYTKAVVTVQEQSLTRYKQENPWYRFENYMTVSGAVSLSHYQVDMAGNEVFQLGVYGAQGEIAWSSSNPAVAYANECGLIVGMGVTGSTVITASVDGEEVKCTVTISAKQREARPKVRSYASSNEEEAVQPVDIIIEGVSGNPPTVNVRLVPVGASTVIDWTSSDDSVATGENGIVTVHGEGEVDFGAETENGLSETIEADTDNLDGIESVTFDSNEAADRPNDIYNLQGVLMKRNASQADVDALAPGLYIVAGKKVLVK